MKNTYCTLNELQLETIIGGEDCFIGDIGCITWAVLKKLGTGAYAGSHPFPTCETYTPAYPGKILPSC